MESWEEEAKQPRGNEREETEEKGFTDLSLI